MRIYSTSWSGSWSASSSTNIRFDRRNYLWYLFNNAMFNMGCTFIASGSSNLAVLHLIICSTLNGPTYHGQSFPGLSFGFRRFVDNKNNNSTLPHGSTLDFLLTLLACCLMTPFYFVSCLWTSVHYLYNINQ